MFNLFTKKKSNNKIKENNELLSKTASLLIHAAKIDEKYSNKEKEIIKKILIELGVKKIDINKVMIDAEINEDKANQILDFTREIKNTNHAFKTKIIEALWKIIYSDEEADMYEASLMRRLAGLLYIDRKTMGDIKVKIKNDLNR
tara:strand:- start:345 stop:779 length:435 start_codon:yes stop_codon:yes gene_type:complete